jgi:hypothetical protein
MCAELGVCQGHPDITCANSHPEAGNVYLPDPQLHLHQQPVTGLESGAFWATLIFGTACVVMTVIWVYGLYLGLSNSDLLRLLVAGWA